MRVIITITSKNSIAIPWKTKAIQRNLERKSVPETGMHWNYVDLKNTFEKVSRNCIKFYTCAMTKRKKLTTQLNNYYRAAVNEPKVDMFTLISCHIDGHLSQITHSWTNPL